jgi:hypothetical protein
VGPNAIKELIRVIKPKGLLICSIAESIFIKNGFQEEIYNLRFLAKVKKISTPFIALPKKKE